LMLLLWRLLTTKKFIQPRWLNRWLNRYFYPYCIKKKNSEHLFGECPSV
jgi:hypothetical protein